MTTAKKNQGVTLIELMIAIAVVAILAVIALPSFERTIERRRMNGAAENIFALLQYAKSESIKQNRIVTVQFDVGEWCLGLDDAPVTVCNCAATPANCTVAGIEKTLMGSDFKDVALTVPAAAPGFAGTSFEFDPPRGMPDDDGRFQVSTPHNEMRCIELGLPGQIKITNEAC